LPGISTILRFPEDFAKAIVRRIFLLGITGNYQHLPKAALHYTKASTGKTPV
jgi:hypothetical protein